MNDRKSVWFFFFCSFLSFILDFVGGRVGWPSSSFVWFDMCSTDVPPLNECAGLGPFFHYGNSTQNKSIQLWRFSFLVHFVSLLRLVTKKKLRLARIWLFVFGLCWRGPSTDSNYLISKTEIMVEWQLAYTVIFGLSAHKHTAVAFHLLKSLRFFLIQFCCCCSFWMALVWSAVGIIIKLKFFCKVYSSGIVPIRTS